MPLFSNNSKFVLHIHIPKCGGSSVEDILAQKAETMSIFYADEAHEFPCNPQHFQLNLLRHLTPNFDTTPSFAVVRHPLLRIISEYKYRQKLLKRSRNEPRDFSKEVISYFKDYGFNPYIHDNHIRPQIEFVSDSTHIFKLENGLHHAINFALLALKGESEALYTEHNHLPKTLKSEYDTLLISGKTIELIQEFYRSDYEAFSYRKIDVPNHEKLEYKDLKKELLKERHLRNIDGQCEKSNGELSKASTQAKTFCRLFQNDDTGYFKNIYMTPKPPKLVSESGAACRMNFQKRLEITKHQRIFGPTCFPDVKCKVK